jgi:hypothetical protein
MHRSSSLQGGTGVNLTPPPPQLVSPEALSAAMRHVEAASHRLGIEGFARVDAFMHVDTGEVRTLPRKYKARNMHESRRLELH